MIEKFEGANIGRDEEQKFSEISKKEEFGNILESVLSRYIDEPVEIQAILEVAEREVVRGASWLEIKEWLEELLPKYTKGGGDSRRIIRKLEEQLKMNQVYFESFNKKTDVLKTLKKEEKKKEKDNLEKE